MKTINIIFLAIAAVAVGVAIYFIFTLSRGTLNVTIDNNSPVKTNVHFWLSKDNFQKQYSAPSKVSLTKGAYTISATGDSSAEFRTTFTVTAKQQTNVSITLSLNPDNHLGGTSDNPSTVPYYNLFPHDGGDYRLDAVLDDKQSAISKITATVLHQITPDQTKFYTEERDVMVNAAKKWLSDNGVPDTIPVEVIDQ